MVFYGSTLDPSGRAILDPGGTIWTYLERTISQCYITNSKNLSLAVMKKIYFIFEHKTPAAVFDSRAAIWRNVVKDQ